MTSSDTAYPSAAAHQSRPNPHGIVYAPGTSPDEVEAREQARLNGRIAQYHRQREKEQAARDPKRLVQLARLQTSQALDRLIDLMNGKPGRVKTLNREGEEVEIDVPVPPAVQLRAAEVILERGWGKTPQAMLVQTEEKTAEGVHAMPIMQRIIAIKAARDQNGRTIDLEAAAARLTDENGIVRDEPPAPLPAEPPLDITPEEPEHIPSAGPRPPRTTPSIPPTPPPDDDVI